MKNKIITLGLFIAIIAFASVSKCHAQAAKEQSKPEFDTLKLEPNSVKKLQSIEEQYRNWDDPKWVQQFVDNQKNILAARHQTFIEATIESRGYDPSQARFENYKIFVPKKAKK